MTAPEPKRSTSKPLLVGCGITVLLLLSCGGVLAYFGVKLFRAGFEQAQQDESLARQWEAPAADAPGATFAPDTVAGFDMATSDENGRFPALGIEHEGTHAVYKKGSDTIDVAVYRMSETDAAAVFDEVIRRIDDDERFQSNSYLRLTRSLRFSVDPPAMHGVLWQADGWLVFVRSQTVSDLDGFLKAYLEAMEPTPGDD